ncbi:MAG: hypothetical protein ABI232_13515, partial [Jatrophihabitantaceae bacterium]
PIGCGLDSVNTRYGAVQLISGNAGQVTVQATAELTASTLVCNGTTVAKADGSGPARLHITLVRTGARYVISNIAR